MAASTRQIWRNSARSASLPSGPCSTKASSRSALRTGMNWSRSAASVADLTFLPALPRVLCRNVKSIATLESLVASVPLVPTFVHERGPNDTNVGTGTLGRPEQNSSLRGLIIQLRIGAEGRAGLRVDIEHVPAAIERKLGARGVADRRQMVEHVAAHGIGGDHIAGAMGNE